MNVESYLGSHDHSTFDVTADLKVSIILLKCVTVCPYICKVRNNVCVSVSCVEICMALM